ncbi:phosphoglycerate mutase-like protein 1 isoform X1 [Iris pallida]|uniref:Phosphoglycerate mutase-like protein 1 isoform X1 n=1 Tax=Iris pallida TaxID=29817 RepID=A0AAX6HF12_IRIPA|nr:phosphoglycerate mutase-like protein 1 isoform X1 [Iris pallida]
MVKEEATRRGTKGGRRGSQSSETQMNPLGFKNDKHVLIEKKGDNGPVFRNKEKVLVTCSRRIIYREFTLATSGEI